MAPRKRQAAPADAEQVIEAEVVEDEETREKRNRLQADLYGPPPKRKDSKALAKTVGEEGELSGLDARLLQAAAAGKSLVEIGEEYGLPPARAGQRIREILSSRDWLSNMERDQLLMQEMIELKNQIQDLVRRYSEADFLHAMDPRWATTLQKVLNDLGKMAQERQKRIGEQKVTFRSAHAKVVTAAIEKALRLTMHELRERGYELPEAEVRDAMEDALPRAFQEITERTETV